VYNPSGFAVTLSAAGQSLAYVVTQQTGTLTYHSELDNFGGRMDKWLQDPVGRWYFILPTGELDIWDGGSGATGTLLGKVGVSYYADPTLLTDPPADSHATFSVTGSTLTITRDLAWTSSMVVTVMVDNGHGSDSKSFNLTVTTGPALSGIADLTIPSSQQTLDVPLTVANPSGNPLTYTVTAQSLAYILTQQTGTLTYYSMYDNVGGRGEKWLQAASGQWYFILSSGELDVWNGAGGANGTSLGNVGASYYIDPSRLTDPPVDPHATFTVTGSTLTITRDRDWISTLVITVTVDDGSQSDSKTFDVFVTP
jgi:hypothetical protein